MTETAHERSYLKAVIERDKYKRLADELAESLESISSPDHFKHTNKDYWLNNYDADKMAETLANDTAIARKALSKYKNSLEEV